MTERNTRDAVMEAEEALLDAIEVYAHGTDNKLLLEEYMNFPASLVTKARRLREVIYAHEGLAEDYLAGIALVESRRVKVEITEVTVLTEEDLKAASDGADEYIIAQEDLLGSIEDYNALFWQGEYADITSKARHLREAVALNEDLGESYLNSEGGGMMGMAEV